MVRGEWSHEMGPIVNTSLGQQSEKTGFASSQGFREETDVEKARQEPGQKTRGTQGNPREKDIYLVRTH